MMTGARLEICGGIATGKTTLAHRLAPAWGGTLVLEDFQRNPFWERFYRQPQRYAHEKNVCFLAQHLGELKDHLDQPVTVCDYAAAQDLAYAALDPDPAHPGVMQALYRHLSAALPPPRLVVHLQCDAVLQLERIRARGRRQEDAITVDYLHRLNEALCRLLAAPPWPCPVVSVRSDEIDFAHDDAQAHALSLRLREAFEAAPVSR